MRLKISNFTCTAHARRTDEKEGSGLLDIESMHTVVDSGGRGDGGYGANENEGGTYRHGVTDTVDWIYDIYIY